MARCIHLQKANETFVDAVTSEETPVTVEICDWPNQNPDRFLNAPRWLLRLTGSGLAVWPEHDCVGCPGYRAERTDEGEKRRVILLAEDEAIIAFELADSLAREGFEVAGPFDTCAAAEAWLRSACHVDGAILDNILKDGPCDALARGLRERKVPFVIRFPAD